MPRSRLHMVLRKIPRARESFAEGSARWVLHQRTFSFPRLTTRLSRTRCCLSLFLAEHALFQLSQRRRVASSAQFPQVCKSPGETGRCPLTASSRGDREVGFVASFLHLMRTPEGSPSGSLPDVGEARACAAQDGKCGPHSPAEEGAQPASGKAKVHPTHEPQTTPVKASMRSLASVRSHFRAARVAAAHATGTAPASFLRAQIDPVFMTFTNKDLEHRYRIHKLPLLRVRAVASAVGFAVAGLLLAGVEASQLASAHHLAVVLPLRAVAIASLPILAIFSIRSTSPAFIQGSHAAAFTWLGLLQLAAMLVCSGSDAGPLTPGATLYLSWGHLQHLALLLSPCLFWQQLFVSSCAIVGMQGIPVLLQPWPERLHAGAFLAVCLFAGFVAAVKRRLEWASRRRFVHKSNVSVGFARVEELLHSMLPSMFKQELLARQSGGSSSLRRILQHRSSEGDLPAGPQQRRPPCWSCLSALHQASRPQNGGRVSHVPSADLDSTGSSTAAAPHAAGVNGVRRIRFARHLSRRERAVGGTLEELLAARKAVLPTSSSKPVGFPRRSPSPRRRAHSQSRMSSPKDSTPPTRTPQRSPLRRVAKPPRMPAPLQLGDAHPLAGGSGSSSLSQSPGLPTPMTKRLPKITRAFSRVVLGLEEGLGGTSPALGAACRSREADSAGSDDDSELVRALDSEDSLTFPGSIEGSTPGTPALVTSSTPEHDPPGLCAASSAAQPSLTHAHTSPATPTAQGKLGPRHASVLGQFLSSRAIEHQHGSSVSSRHFRSERALGFAADEATVLFLLVDNFHVVAAEVDPLVLVSCLNDLYIRLDSLAERFGVYKVMAQGNMYMCVSGVPEPQADHVLRACSMAAEVQEDLAENPLRLGSTHVVALKAGIHTGPVAAGVIGTRSLNFHVFGDTVNVASRMASTGQCGAVHLSAAAAMALEAHGDGVLATETRGVIHVKGKGGMRTRWLQWSAAPSCSLQSLNSAHMDDGNKAVPSLGSQGQLHLASLHLEDVLNDVTLEFKSKVLEGLFLEETKRKLRRSSMLCSPATAGVLAALSVLAGLSMRAGAPLAETVSLAAAAVLCLVAGGLAAAFKKGSLHLFALGCAALLVGAFIAVHASLLWPSGTAHPGPPAGYAELLLLGALYCTPPFRFTAPVALAVTGAIIGLAAIKLSSSEIWSRVVLAATTLGVVWVESYAAELTWRQKFHFRTRARTEQTHCERILENMLPSPSHARTLMRGGVIVEALPEVTVLCADVCDFTPLCSRLTPEQLIRLLDAIYSAFDDRIDQYGVYKVDTIGDAVVVVSGMKGHASFGNHQLAMALYAMDMVRELERIRKDLGIDVEMRIGMHSGHNVVGAVLGAHRPRYLIWGRVAEVANLVESSGVPSQIHVSESTYTALQQHGFDLERRGFVNAMNRPLATALLRGIGGYRVPQSPFLNRSPPKGAGASPATRRRAQSSALCEPGDAAMPVSRSTRSNSHAVVDSPGGASPGPFTALPALGAAQFHLAATAPDSVAVGGGVQAALHAASALNASDSHLASKPTFKQEAQARQSMLAGATLSPSQLLHAGDQRPVLLAAASAASLESFPPSHMHSDGV